MAAKSDKVIYLKTEEKSSIKAFVIDYLFDTETEKKYVIVAADSKGTNAKVYEIENNEAFILNKKTVSLFQNYKTNSRFQNITSDFKDGKTFELIKKETIKKDAPIKEEVIYYVYDQGTLRAYKAEMYLNENKNLVFSNPRFIQTWKKVNLDDIKTVVSEQKHDKTVYVIEDKINDMIFDNGNIIAVKWSIVEAEVLDSKKDEIEEKDELSESEISSDNKITIEPSGEVVYYVFDHGVVRAYQAKAVFDSENHPTFTDIQCIHTWKNKNLEDIEKIILEQQYSQTVYIIEDKMNDMIFENNSVKALNWSKFEPSLEHNKENQVFYVYDGNVIKKYNGTVAEKTEESVELSNVQLLETINGAADLNVEQFLEGENVELNAYFVDSKDFIFSSDKAVLKNIRQKGKQKIKEEEKIEEISNEEKIILVNGDIDVYGGKTHYSILGCVCTIKSKSPLTIVAERSGVKTISFEDENATSITETCQAYQNLYPNIPIYLSKGVEILDSEEHILEDKDYMTFVPQKQEEYSSLASGKKVLTVEEMSEKRKLELQELQKKRENLIDTEAQKKSLADESLKTGEKNQAFENYIHSLESVGITEEQMKATGLIDEPSLSLSESFRKHYIIVKGINEGILQNIEKMESFGHTPLQIVQELQLPVAMIEQLKQDVPELNHFGKISEDQKAM